MEKVGFGCLVRGVINSTERELIQIQPNQKSWLFIIYVMGNQSTFSEELTVNVTSYNCISHNKTRPKTL